MLHFAMRLSVFFIVERQFFFMCKFVWNILISLYKVSLSWGVKTPQLISSFFENFVESKILAFSFIFSPYLAFYPDFTVLLFTSFFVCDVSHPCIRHILNYLR